MVSFHRLITMCHGTGHRPASTIQAVPPDPLPRTIKRMNRGISTSDEQRLPRFGPVYRRGEPLLLLLMKEEAWKFVLRKSVGDGATVEEGTVIEKYVTAIRNIEQTARECYGREAEELPGKEFRFMMIKDGCFFLLLAFVLLGAYQNDDIIFSEMQSKKNVQRWIKSMLLVGNQIPVVVLRELMRQSYFEEIFNQIRYTKPQGIVRTMLHKLLGFPDTGASWEDSVDLLHALQCYVVGTRPNPVAEAGEDTRNVDNFDVELGMELNNDTTEFLSASEMKQSGIGFQKGRRGSKNIQFVTNIFGCGSLTLPALVVDDDTEVVMQSLVEYEDVHYPQNSQKREVTSYLRTMKNVIRSMEDMKILRDKRIVAAESLVYNERLLRVLSRLDCETSMTPDLRRVRLLSSNHTRPFALKITKVFFNAVVIISVVQTVFSGLSYFYPLQKNS